MTKKIHPKTSMGSKRLVEVSICMWVDLLGYGSMLKKVDFDPTHANAAEAINRLLKFHKVVFAHSVKNFPTVVMNDGAIAYRTLSPRSKSVTHDFLNRAYKLHCQINESDFADGYYGARSVIAVGFRMRTKSNAKSGLINGIGAHLIEMVEGGNISFKEAILKALAIKPNFDVVPELQANFAFTKAYLADSAGSEGGFAGPNFFVDINLFPEKIPNWLTYKKQPFLNEPGIGGNFIQVEKMENFNLNAVNNDLLDAFEISEKISKSRDVPSKLKGMQWVPY